MTDAICLPRIDGEIGILTIDSPPLNVLSSPVRTQLYDGLATLLADASVKAVVIACAGRTFCAGADITEFNKPFVEPVLKTLFERMDAAEKPIVAAIHGTALGGGVELALACHYRIALAAAKLGLPEVKLGLLPGAGGTQRGTRLIGVARALDLIVGGQPLSAGDALAAGLIDAIVEGPDLIAVATDFARRLVAEHAPVRRTRDIAARETPEEASAIIDAYRSRQAGLFRGFKAPTHIARAIHAATELPFDNGLDQEWELFEELMGSTESAAQRHLFFAERAAAKIPVAKDAKPRPIASVAVIGAGTMGSGIALAFLNAGLAVTVIDVNASGLERGRTHIERTITQAAAKGRITQGGAQKQLANLTTADTLDAAANADLVVEAIFERLDLKQDVFRTLDAITRRGAILASNTSFLDLDAIAAVTKRPEDVVGLHFFAPANIMRLLEVVRGHQTADDVLVTAMALGRRLGKVAILSGVCDGFIANRAMARRTESADRLILNGPMPWEIDAALVDFGFPMGSFQMFDLVGLDVIGWDRNASAGRTVQEVLCEAGHWGQKSGQGYYVYDDLRRSSPSPFAEEVICDFAGKRGLPARQYDNAEIVQMLLDPVVNEGAKLLEEGIALRASDIDLALVTGYAWPVYTGGPMFWGSAVGLDAIVKRLETRCAAGEPIIVSALLKDMAKRGDRFL
jgi:3-hydroxyacyl-CoA dehydrogenase